MDTSDTFCISIHLLLTHKWRFVHAMILKENSCQYQMHDCIHELWADAGSITFPTIRLIVTILYIQNVFKEEFICTRFEESQHI